jgi:3-deoxy-D-manno-octulosonic-acid transferase
MKQAVLNQIPRAARLPLLIYNVLFPVALLLMLPGLLRRMFRRGHYRHKFLQRFGRYDAGVTNRLQGASWTWIHAISVGETLVALKLARKMRELHPELHVVLSVTTSTGFALAESKRTDWMEIIYNPLDLRSIVRRALRVIRPERLIFIEAMWPNLLIEAKKASVPVAMIPRLSPRSERRFRKFRFLTGPVFSALDLMCLQEPEDPLTWQQLGAEGPEMQVTGSIKYDQEEAARSPGASFRDLLRKMNVAEETPILLAGSTFPGEEKIVASVYQNLRKQHPKLFLIIVPRHVERTDEVAADLISAGLSFTLRTAPEPRPADCLVVNTTGELRDWYALATIVFIGKSLTAVGGQNPVEPVMAGKPVIFGPHMENFRSMVEKWLAADAAIRVRDAAELETQIDLLLRNPARREELAARAKKIALEHQNATERTARLLLDI